MTEKFDPHKIFHENISMHASPKKRKEALDQLISVANYWEEKKDFLEAATAFDFATHPAWAFDDKLLIDCYNGAIRNYENVLNENSSEYEMILSFNGIIQTLNSVSYFSVNKSEIQTYRTLLVDKFSAYLISQKSNDPKTLYFIIRGFSIKFDMKKNYEYIFDQANYSEDSGSWGSGHITRNITSAFKSLISIPDYKSAETIVNEFEKYFDTYELNGWKYAILGHNYTDKSDEMFYAASVEFGKDTHENLEIERKAGKRNSWSAINVTLWSKYFESRSWLSKAILGKEEFKKCVIEAANAIKECDRGFVNYRVLKYRTIMLFFAHLVDKKIGYNAKEALKEYKKNLRFTGTEEQDERILRFFNDFQVIVKEHTNDPKAAILSPNIQTMVRGIDSLSYFSDNVTDLVKPAIGQYIVEVTTGGTNWIHRTLESISNEDLFRKLLLRLFQHPFPLFAQIVHGTIEHGKDIIVLSKDETGNTLRMYQAKVGGINTDGWREVKPQLEEIFEVDPPESCKNYTIDKTIGYLVFNGHANTITIPKMEGWKALKNEQGLSYEFLDLDGLVRYILENKLIGELRYSLKELNLPIIGD